MNKPILTILLLTFLVSRMLVQTATATTERVSQQDTSPSFCSAHASPFSQPPLNSTQLAAHLGWVNVPHLNICGGYYEEPLLIAPNTPLPDIKISPVEIHYDQATFYQVGHSLLTGKIKINQPGRSITGDHVLLNRNTEGNVTTVDLYGNVVLREPGKLVTGNCAHVYLNKKRGDFHQAHYRLLLKTPPNPQPAPPQKNENNSVTGLVVRGEASLVRQIKRGLYHLENASYTSCTPDDSAWLLRAKQIDLDHETGRGVARSATLHLHNIPVLYTPYFNFPLDDRRQSGFLFPTYGNSSTGGFDISFPYYWNLAPNYDATITPHLYTKRGLQLNGLYRYLTQESSGSIVASILPHDRAFQAFQRSAATDFANNIALPKLLDSSSNREYYSLQDTTTFNPHWGALINYSGVSDDYYFEDFNNITALPIPNQIPRLGTVTYRDDTWNFVGLLSTYQTLHPVNQSPINDQYSRLPQLILNGNWPSMNNQLSYSWSSELTYFVRSLSPGEITPSANGQPPSGTRANIQPGLSLPLTSASGYFTPSAQFEMTQYNLIDQPVSYPTTITRSLPIFNIDSGVYFDRDTSFGGTSYSQTLEPRAFYLFVPYHPQYNIPVFDTASQPFSYDQLFRLNRFTGMDRIGDANQVSLALTTRFLNQDTGLEKFRASIGRIYYFRNRRVMLCNTRGCQDPLTIVGATSPTESASPLAGQMSYNFNPAWNATANLAWDPKTHSTTSGNLNFQYQPIQNHILNLGYNFVQFGDVLTGISPQDGRNNLSQSAVSFAWPIKQNWRAIGNWNYNLSHRHAQTYFYGLEYDSCCWAVRMITGRTFTGLDGNNNPVFNKQVYLQLQLKGFGNVGSTDTSGILGTAIPGYHDNFGQIS